jgi:hypothetical protein
MGQLSFFQEKIIEAPIVKYEYENKYTIQDTIIIKKPIDFEDDSISPLAFSCNIYHDKSVSYTNNDAFTGETRDERIKQCIEWSIARFFKNKKCEIINEFSDNTNKL